MGLLAKKIKENQEGNQFKPLELNEMNVKTIFDRCYAMQSSTNACGIHLFTEYLRT